MKIKVFYSEECKLLYARNWPVVPQVMASIYVDQLAMNTYERQLKETFKYAIEVANKDEVMAMIAFSQPIERDKFYELEGGIWFDDGMVKITKT